MRTLIVIAPPKNLLNCYEILNASELSRPVNIYRVEFADPADQTQENRGRAKQVIWDLRGQHRVHCRGYGFVVDLNPWEVAVPASWKLPDPAATPEYCVTLSRSFEAKPRDPEGRAIIAGILREAIKRHFKDNPAPELGDLWQDYDAFCQHPANTGDEDHLMCHRSSFSVKILAGGIFAVQTCVSTTTVDARTLADYYRAGDVATLAAMIEASQALSRRLVPKF